MPDKEAFVEDVRQALWASKVVAYSQGFDEIRTGGVEFGWNINVADCAKIWRDGCIIRAKLLENIRQEYSADAGLVSLMAARPSPRSHDTTTPGGVVAPPSRPASLPGLCQLAGLYDMARAPRTTRRSPGCATTSVRTL